MRQRHTATRAPRTGAPFGASGSGRLPLVLRFWRKLPPALTLNVDESRNLTVAADGPAGMAITYSWQIDGETVPGWTTPTVPVKFTNIGRYVVTATATSNTGDVTTTCVVTVK